MRKSRVEFSVLNRKAAIEASSVALGVRMASRLSTGRTTAFSHSTKGVPFVHTEQIAFSSSRPSDRVHQERLEILVKSADAEIAQARLRVGSAEPQILLWPERDGSFDFKKLASIGRRGKRTAQGFDPNAEDADGDMLVQDGTPWERPKVPGASKRGRRKPGKTRVAVASGLERVADRIDEAAERRRSRREERGSLRERIAGRLEGAADRLDKKPGQKPKKVRRSPGEAFGDYLYGTDRVKPSRERPEEPGVADETVAPETPSAPEKPDAEVKPEKPKTPVEDVTTTATAKEKLPGRVIGKPDEDKSFVAVAARNASARKEDAYGNESQAASVVHVVENADGKFVAVDDERLSAMDGAKPLFTFRDGGLTHVDGEKRKKSGKTVTSEQVEAAPGWSMDETYKGSAIDRLSTLENTYFYKNGGKQFEEGENAYVIETSDGKFYIVDEEKMQALGVEPIRAEKTGRGEFIYGTEPKQDFVPRKVEEPKPVGEIPGEPPMEKPSLPDVAEDAKSPKSKKPKLKGKQDGKYKTEKNAAKRADQLSAEDGKTRHVVEAPGGGYAVVDQERLDAMGVEAVSTHNGKKIDTPVPQGEPEPGFVPPTVEETEDVPVNLPSFLQPKPGEQEAGAGGIKPPAKWDWDGTREYAQSAIDAAEELGKQGKLEESRAVAKEAKKKIAANYAADETTSESLSALLDELEYYSKANKSQVLAKLNEDDSPYRRWMDFDSSYSEDSSYDLDELNDALRNIEDARKQLSDLPNDEKQALDESYDDMINRLMDSEEKIGKRRDLEEILQEEEEIASAVKGPEAKPAPEKPDTAAGKPRKTIGLDTAKSVMEERISIIRDIAEMDGEDEEEITDQVKQAFTETSSYLDTIAANFDQIVFDTPGSVASWAERMRERADATPDPQEADAYKIVAEVLDDNPNMSSAVQVKIQISALSFEVMSMGDKYEPGEDLLGSGPTNESVTKKLDEGAVGLAETLNATMSGKYDDDTIESMQSTFKEAVYVLESLTPDEKAVMGDNYDAALEGAKNNIEILERLKGTGEDIGEVAKRFWEEKAEIPSQGGDNNKEQEVLSKLVTDGWLDENGDLKATTEQAQVMLNAYRSGLLDGSFPPETMAAVVALEKAIKAKADKDPLDGDSPLPYKTSQYIDVASLEEQEIPGSEGDMWDVEGLQEQFSEFMDLAKKDLISYWADPEKGAGGTVSLTKSMDDDQVEQEFLKTIAALEMAVNAGVATNPGGELPVAKLQRIKTHYHNFQVMAGRGKYSPENSPNLTPIDRFNHLSPSGQQSFLKAMENNFRGLAADDPDISEEEIDDVVREAMVAYNGILGKKGKAKKAKKAKPPAEQMKDSVVDGPSPEPAKPKAGGKSIRVGNGDTLSVLSPDEAEKAGVPKFDPNTEAKFPEGLIVGYIGGDDPDEDVSAAIIEAQLKGHQLFMPGDYEEGSLFASSFSTSDGKRVTVLLDNKHPVWESEGGLDAIFPNLYDQAGTGDVSNWVNLGELRQDKSPKKGSPLHGKTVADFDSSDVEAASVKFGPEAMELRAAIKALGEDPYSIFVDDATGMAEDLDKIMQGRFGPNGGVLVKTKDGMYHVVSRNDWQEITSGLSDDERGEIGEVVHSSKPESMNWALKKDTGTWSNPSKKLSDIDWDSIPKDEATEALKAFLENTTQGGVGQIAFGDSMKAGGISHPYGGLSGYTLQTLIDEHQMAFDQAGEESDSPNPSHPLNIHQDGRWGVFAFEVANQSDLPAAGKRPVVMRIGGKDLDFALKHPEVFGQPLLRYDRDTAQTLGNASDGTASASSFTGDLSSAVDAMFDDSVVGSELLKNAVAWRLKLDNKASSYGGGISSVEKVIGEAEDRLKAMRVTVDAAKKIAAGDLSKDEDSLTLDDLKPYLAQVSPDIEDPDAFVGKLKSTVVRLDVSNRYAANMRMAEQDGLETEIGLKDRLANNPKSAKDMVNEEKDVQNQLDAATKDLDSALAALDAAKSGDDVKKAYQQMANAESRISNLKAVRDAYGNALKDYKQNTAVLNVGGDSYDVPKNTVISTDLPSLEKATDVSAAVAPMFPDGTSLGIYKDSSGQYSIMKLDDAIAAGMPAPEAVFSSNGVGAIPTVDTTASMDLKTAPGMPKLPDGYKGTQVLGVNSFDGTAVGQYVPTPMLPDGSNPPIDENHPLVKEWAAKVSDGTADISDVPNDLLKEVVWANTQGGGGGSSGRFKLLSKASGYNDIGKSPKDQTQRFMDTATGQTFVIKSATRNDQEGIRELFGNQVMQLLGFPSSGGRTAGPVEKSPNKFPPGHPEHDPEAEQVAVLIESSEMLYDGKPLGHVRSLPKDERADIVARLTPESVGAGLVMDSLFRYYDRQEDNWIAVELPDGTVAYHPIDHGNAFGPFKGHKFYDKDGKKLGKSQSSPADEDKLGLMFSGLDGDGVWNLAKESMTTPERRSAFAEGVLHAVRKAESTDYAEAGERLISEQNLTGQLAERVRTSAKELEGKKGRLDSYVDPMLRELGMTDDEIASIRAKVDTDLGGGLAKASQAPKKAVPASPASKMVSPTPIKGEEAFGNSPIAEGAKTVTSSLDSAVALPGSVHYTSVGAGRQTKDGVRFVSWETNKPGEQVVSAGMTLDSETAKKLGAALTNGVDLQGNPVEVLKSGLAHIGIQLKGGKWTYGDTPPDSATQGIGDYGPAGERFVIARLQDGTIVSVNYSSIDPKLASGSSYSTRDVAQVIYTDGKPSPERVASSLSAMGVSDLGYAGENDWKGRAAELLVRTYDNELANSGDQIAQRLARIASEYGVTLNDVEPYHDSMGRLRYRLTEEAWDRVVQKKPGLGKTTHIAKSMNNVTDGANVVRVITTGGMLSKQEQVLSGSGLVSGAAVGGGGVGASPGSDLTTGGGLGLFMTPYSGDSDMGGPNGVHAQSISYWGGSAAVHVVYDGQGMMRDLGWWAHGPSDGPYGALNAATYHGQAALNNPQYGGDSITAMDKGMVFEFLPNGSAALDNAMGVIVSATVRTQIIDALKAKGITQVNGIPLEKFVVSKSAKKQLTEMLGPRWKKDYFGSVGTKQSTGTV
jgi:hypothetical protein